MLRSADNSNDECYEQDMQRIQHGYKMLDDIENKLKCYLDSDVRDSDGDFENAGTKAGFVRPNMQELIGTGGESGQERDGSKGSWDSGYMRYGGQQSPDQVRIVKNPPIDGNKINDYSFRRPAFNSDKLTFDERPRDSNERKPASPISGLDDKMRTIEEKIQKYKQENEQFENKSQKHVDTKLDSLKTALNKPPAKPLQTRRR